MSDSTQDDYNKDLAALLKELPRYSGFSGYYQAQVSLDSERGGVFGLSGMNEPDEMNQFLQNVSALNLEGIFVDEKKFQIQAQNVEQFCALIGEYSEQYIEDDHMEEFVQDYVCFLMKHNLIPSSREDVNPFEGAKYPRSASTVFNGFLALVRDASAKIDKNAHLGMSFDYDDTSEDMVYSIACFGESPDDKVDGHKALKILHAEFVELAQHLPVEIQLSEVDGIWRITLSGQNPTDFQSLLIQCYASKGLVGPEDVHLHVQGKGLPLNSEQSAMVKTFQDEFNQTGLINDFDYIPMTSTAFSHEKTFENFLYGYSSSATTSLLEIEAIISNELGIVPNGVEEKALFQRFVFH